MCLVICAWQAHHRYRLVVAANRDEFHARPSQPMNWWPDAEDLLAGRDLQAGGTWLGLSRGGRFATVTNYREPARQRPGLRSRGELVSRFLSADAAPRDYVDGLDPSAYAGYSLLLADTNSLFYASNRDGESRELDSGVYGLSNATLDTPWPKLTRTRDGVAQLLDDDNVNPSALFRLLADDRPAPVNELDDKLPFAMARAVSSPFIRAGDYGTRCTTVVLAEHDGTTLVCERRFDKDGKAAGDSEFRFNAGGT